MSLNEVVQIKDEAALKTWVISHLSWFSKGGLFLLKGNLAAGKTTLVSYVVEALGGEKRQVSSPTFALHHSYKTPSLVVDHMDLYRLETEYDLLSSGFDEVLEAKEHLAFIEWADRVDDSVYQGLDRMVYELELKVLEDQSSRQLSIRRLHSAS